MYSTSEINAVIATVAAAYLSRNIVEPGEIALVLRSVREGLLALAAPPVTEPEPREPAVPVKKSVTPDYIVCLEDGKKLKMLKRHLRTEYRMTPEEYRAKWGLAPDYPMVAPNYAEKRSALAKKAGLGKRKAA